MSRPLLWPVKTLSHRPELTFVDLAIDLIIEMVAPAARGEIDRHLTVPFVVRLLDHPGSKLRALLLRQSRYGILNGLDGHNPDLRYSRSQCNVPLPMDSIRPTTSPVGTSTICFVFRSTSSTNPSASFLPALIRQGTPIRSASLNFTPGRSSRSS